MWNACKLDCGARVPERGSRGLRKTMHIIGESLQANAATVLMMALAKSAFSQRRTIRNSLRRLHESRTTIRIGCHDARSLVQAVYLSMSPKPLNAERDFGPWKFDLPNPSTAGRVSEPMPVLVCMSMGVYRSEAGSSECLPREDCVSQCRGRSCCGVFGQFFVVYTCTCRPNAVVLLPRASACMSLQVQFAARLDIKDACSC